MSEVKNLERNKTIEKLREMVKAAPIAMLCTNLSEKPFSACPMATQQVDENGDIWFMSTVISRHSGHISQDSQVQLVYTNHNASSYLTIYGTAEILFNRAKVDELWTPLAKAWFKEGKEDQDLTLLKVTPQEGYYWDTKNGQMVSFIKRLTSAVSGRIGDDAVQGGLTI